MRRVVSLAGTVLVLESIVLVLVAFPVGAQESGGIPPGTAATGVDTDNTNSPPDLIEVAASECTVSPGASITLEDGDGTQARFVDGELEVSISEQDGSPTIVGPTDDFIGDHGTFPDTDTAFDTDGDYTVVSSTGIACEGGGAPDDGTTPPADDKVAGPVDDQYDKVDKPGGPPGDVSNPKDVVPGSDVNKKVPVTGGPPFILLAAAGLILSVALISGLGLLRR